MYVQPNELGTKDTTVTNKWVLIHDGEKVSRLAGPVSCRVITKNELFVVDTKEQAEAEVTRLNLKVKTHGKAS